jgi:antitoxin PrlF
MNILKSDVALRVQSRLTERSQTTIPPAVRDALHLMPGEYLEYSLLAGGQVMLSRQQEEEEHLDPVIQSFLSFLDKDMEANPQNLKPLDASLFARINELTAGMDTDIDAELTDDD